MAKTLVVSVPGSDVYAMIVYSAGYTEVRVLRNQITQSNGGPFPTAEQVHSFRLPSGKGSARQRVQVYLETIKKLSDERIKTYLA